MNRRDNKMTFQSNYRDNIGQTQIRTCTMRTAIDQWRNVKNEDDIREYYTTYFPCYPKELVDAIVVRMKEKLEAAKNNELGADDYLEGYKRSSGFNDRYWDYKEDVINELKKCYAEDSEKKEEKEQEQVDNQ